MQIGEGDIWGEPGIPSPRLTFYFSVLTRDKNKAEVRFGGLAEALFSIPWCPVAFLVVYYNNDNCVAFVRQVAPRYFA